MDAAGNFRRRGPFEKERERFDAVGARFMIYPAAGFTTQPSARLMMRWP